MCPVFCILLVKAVTDLRDPRSAKEFVVLPVLKPPQYSINDGIRRKRERERDKRRKKIKDCEMCLISAEIIGPSVAQFDRLVISVPK